MEEKKDIILRVISFSTSPGPRYCNQGDDSGEAFYHKRLNKTFYDAIQADKSLVVDLDGTDGYASSFLDEAFGNLVFDFGEDKVTTHLKIKSDEEPEWKNMILHTTIPQWTTRRQKGETPKKTENHEPWKRINDKGQIEEVNE